MRVATVALVVLLAGCGGDPEPRAAAPSKPLAGTFDVDGHAMFIECKGSGGPTVVLDSGLGVDSASTWAAVRPQVARFTACASTTAPGWRAASRDRSPARSRR